MRIGIELRQLIPQKSGGIVPLLEGVLGQMITAGPDNRYFVYYVETGYRLPQITQPNVQARPLDAATFWRDLDQAAADDALDVLVSSYPSDEPLAFPAARHIVFIPDLQHEDMPEFFNAEVLARRRQAFSAAIADAGAVVVLSAHTQSLLLSRYPQAKGRVSISRPVLNITEDAMEPPLTADERDLIPEQPYFLFPANIWPHKNHRRLIAALRLFLSQRDRAVGLVLTGDPAGWAELQAECADLPVYHLGFVSRRSLTELYRHACALTYFSLYEGFGIPLLEAFQSGAPVLCSNVTSLPEIGQDAVLSCDPTDVAAIAELMGRIVDSDELRAQLVERGTKRIADYTSHVNPQQLLQVCQQVVERPIPYRSILAAIGLLSRKLAESDADRAARLDIIHQVTTGRLAEAQQLRQQIVEIESDRAARLEIIQRVNAQIQQLQVKLMTSEADRDARLKVIERLQEELAAQHSIIESMQQQIETVQAERILYLDRSLRQEAIITQLRHELYIAEMTFHSRAIRKVRRMLGQLWQS
jgi:glycosyltransferase involved in cell wall biosynthesis